MPITMGFDLTQGWYAAMKRQADELGYEIIVRDPNWSIDAGAQALNQLIDEKPDILIFHALDMQALQQADQKGRGRRNQRDSDKLKSPNNGDAYVGRLVCHRRWRPTSLFACAARSTARTAKWRSSKACPPAHQPDRPDGNPGQAERPQGHHHRRRPGRGLGCDQGPQCRRHHPEAASRSLRLHRQLGQRGRRHCRRGQGSGPPGQGRCGHAWRRPQAAGCDNIANGNFTSYIKWDVRGQGRDLNDAIKMLLQTKPKPGSEPFALYTPWKSSPRITCGRIRAGRWTRLRPAGLTADGVAIDIATRFFMGERMSMSETYVRWRYRLMPDHIVGEILSKDWIDNAIPVLMLICRCCLFRHEIPAFSAAQPGRYGRQLGEYLFPRWA